MTVVSKILVIGLGNPLVSDDGVGLSVVQVLRERLAAGHSGLRGKAVLEEDTHGGLRLMERMQGYERAIVVDAITTGADPGTLFELSPDDMPTMHSASAHDANLPTALSFGRQVGAVLPVNEAIRLIGVEAADVSTFREALTPQVQTAVPAAADRVLALLVSAPQWDPPAGKLTT